MKETTEATVNQSTTERRCDQRARSIRRARKNPATEFCCLVKEANYCSKYRSQPPSTIQPTAQPRTDLGAGGELGEKLDGHGLQLGLVAEQGLGQLLGPAALDERQLQLVIDHDPVEDLKRDGSGWEGSTQDHTGKR